jgi:hypothetical protein
MKKGRILNTLIICLLYFQVNAQKNNEVRMLHFTSSNTAFPDTGRATGYVYDSVLYTSATHYNDSSVLLVFSNQLKVDSKVDLVFWFHGWRNNIDTAAEYYGLTRQFIAAKRNAVLVLVETAENAPDSYGGKLEEAGRFEKLVDDVIGELKKKEVVPKNTEPGHIILAGHSGAFRVIAGILQMGHEDVQEVLLFDALYGYVDKFITWINLDSSHHFIHWFTNHGGGTDEMSYIMMQQLKDNHISFKLVEETELTPEIIKTNRILFVHSLREHDVIINNPNDFQLLIENSFVLDGSP